MVDNSNDSVFAFERYDDKSRFVFVFNMTPNFYNEYDIGVTQEGVYEEIFNSDKECYGGWNQYNGAQLHSEPGSFEGLPAHMTIKLACFGACIFRKIPPVMAKEEKEEPVIPEKKKASPKKEAAPKKESIVKKAIKKVTKKGK